MKAWILLIAKCLSKYVSEINSLKDITLPVKSKWEVDSISTQVQTDISLLNSAVKAISSRSCPVQTEPPAMYSPVFSENYLAWLDCNLQVRTLQGCYSEALLSNSQIVSLDSEQEFRSSIVVLPTLVNVFGLVGR